MVKRNRAVYEEENRGKQFQETQQRVFVSPARALKDEPPAGVNTQKYFGKYLFMSVLEDRRQDLSTFLEQKGGDPNFVNTENFTPLIAAVKYGRIECAKILVDNGAWVSLATDDHPSPMELAFKQGNRAVAEVLLEHVAKLERDVLINLEK
eukprot:TRINITY_DN16042_c0_g1_i1.p1 TRINITY_DN16042_c0_g1~~TRINITY_DN16042_c0_g1_i1.p1  ORF type:complete len:151 (+),score=42.51 TRINITY_DN16042_c0_g1_i1:51-503(+)